MKRLITAAIITSAAATMLLCYTLAVYAIDDYSSRMSTTEAQCKHGDIVDTSNGFICAQVKP